MGEATYLKLQRERLVAVKRFLKPELAEYVLALRDPDAQPEAVAVLRERVQNAICDWADVDLMGPEQAANLVDLFWAGIEILTD